MLSIFSYVSGPSVYLPWRSVKKNLNMIFLTLLLFHSSNILLAFLKMLVSSLCSMSSILLPVLLLPIMSLQLSFHAIGFPQFSDFGSWPPPAVLHKSEERQCVLRAGCAHHPTAEHEGAQAAQAPVSHTLLQPNCRESPHCWISTRPGIHDTGKAYVPREAVWSRDRGQLQLASDLKQITLCEPQFPHLKNGYIPSMQSHSEC